MKPTVILRWLEEENVWEAYTLEFRRSVTAYDEDPTVAVKQVLERSEDFEAEMKDGGWRIDPASEHFNQMIESMWNVCSNRKEKAAREALKGGGER